MTDDHVPVLATRERVMAEWVERCGGVEGTDSTGTVQRQTEPPLQRYAHFVGLESETEAW